MNETYHSTRGAKGESLHVFITEGLEYYLKNHAADGINILEVGLGTGLNALLTAVFASDMKQPISFTSLEPYPIPSEFHDQLNYAETQESKTLLSNIHSCKWEEEVVLSPYFKLYKTTAGIEDFRSEKQYDVLFFDAFAPNKQPEIWGLDNLKKCFDLLKKDGVLTTYCAQGQFKRNLATAGFQVETLSGAMGKKEMVRATKG
jgi:tRNA U34 5-methylaminomethyl-2-thiouridine-forming methyltransferase MnmC